MWLLSFLWQKLKKMFLLLKRKLINHLFPYRKIVRHRRHHSNKVRRMKIVNFNKKTKTLQLQDIDQPDFFANRKLDNPCLDLPFKKALLE